MARRVAIVTGAGRGIGAAVARRLSADGLDVVVADLDPGAEAVADEVGGAFVQVDVGDEGSVGALASTVAQRYGRIDVVVNNAGIGERRAVGELDAEHVRRTVAVNLLGPVLVTEAALPHVPEEGGRVVHISSGVARHPVRGFAVYGATKGAVEALTRVQALELGPRRIAVNAVAPGMTETGFIERPEEHKQRIVARTALGRLGEPRDIASAVAFLASADADWISGQVLDVDGGYD